MSLKSLLASLTGVTERDNRFTKCTFTGCDNIITLSPHIIVGGVVKREFLNTDVDGAFVGPMGNVYCSRKCFAEMGT